MHIDTLRSLICPTLVVTETPDATVIAAGPITKQPHTLPTRVVLCVTRRGEYVVWNEYLSGLYTDDGTLSPTHYSFSDGNYFRPQEFEKAQTRFAERLLKQVTSGNIASVFRDIENVAA